MSVDNFIPVVWEATLMEALRTSHVFGALVNRDYEGTISAKGDTVNVTMVGDPTIDDYVPGSTTISPEELTTAQRKLTITQSKYFAFKIDDVDKRQAAGELMTSALSNAGYGLRDLVDLFIAAMYPQAQAANVLGERTIDSGQDAYDAIVDLGVVLDEADVPSEGRWAVVPPWYHGFLLKSDLFIRADASGTTAGLRRGQIGEASGFTIFKSNNTVSLNSGDDNIVMAGVRQAISFAEQIASVEAYRPESAFEDAIKGLHVYGGKVMEPAGIATLQASKS